ncbi:Speckle-type POZ protein-like A [Araneus ventricosus]|uniref:Speckle-type POZ protein-like A n=1 Tax=Araneus ventricosus TaxID=182803 RepID=A0A4Y2RDQ9_ARAVE|nr:Speckle-type POZ protein-like A [Araneus ventricosus]
MCAANDMTEFPFNWQLQRGNSIHEKKNRYISNFKINAEWNLICFWNSDHSRPDILEIRRNSTAGDMLVSGTFKLIRGQSCLLQRTFIQLIEAGFATTQIELEYSIGVNCYYKKGYQGSYSITGTLSIPAGVVQEEYAKGIPFESLMELSSDFERLLDPKVTYFADVNLKCGNVSFSAHKNILSVRSPVFAAMFTTEMKEKRENKVDISDISPHVLKTMLTYIYTGKTGELSVQSAGELLFAADMYQLQDLKRVCSDYLKSCVSVQNVLNSLVLGYLHDNDLKVFAMDFICNCCEEFEVLEKTMEWKNLREKRPSLAMDVLTRVITSKDEKLKRFK